MVKVKCNMQMVAIMKELGMITKRMALESTPKPMVKVTMVSL